MEESLPTGVVDAVEVKKEVPVAPKPSPAQDLRDIQALLANGIYPGNVAPAIVKAYQLLEKMAVEIEKNAESK
jgi:hypothetical protein